MLAGLLTLLFLTSCQPAPDPLPEATTETSVYLPFIGERHRPACQGSPKFGLAFLNWPTPTSPTNPRPTDLDYYCAGRYYRTTRTYNWLPQDATRWPLLWCDYNEHNINYYLVATYLAPYLRSGQRVIALNEPEHREQCNRDPETAAAIVWQFQQLLPQAIMVAPNIIVRRDRYWPWAEYLNRFLREYERLAGRAGLERLEIGIHMYYGEWSAKDRVDAVCGTLRGQGLPCRLWVTEYGPGSPDQLVQWVTELDDHPAVRGHFLFIVEQLDNPPGRRPYDLRKGGWRDTPAGEALLGIYRPVPGSN